MAKLAVVTIVLGTGLRDVANRVNMSLSRLLSSANWNSATCDDVHLLQVSVANVDVPGSLQRMAASSRLVLNCVGPYRLWGEPVVAACVRAGTSYLDVCGEPGTYDPNSPASA